MADQPSDEEIVRRVRAGDESAGRLLFDRHLPKLRAAARRRLPENLRRKVADSDVVQEAYLAAFLGLGHFEDRGDGSFERWLRGILDKKIADEVRRFQRGKRDPRREVRLDSRSDAAVPPRAKTASPSSVAAAAEEGGALRAVLAGLPEDYRTVIRLVHEDGLSLAEAGRLMDRSPDAARMLYSRAVAKVADGMGGGRTK